MKIREASTPCNVTVEGYTDFIFINQEGGCLNNVAINKALARIVREYNLQACDDGNEMLPRISCHTFRHTFATRLCEANVNAKAMQDILGHTDIRTTLNIYADASKDFKATEISAFESYMQAQRV